MNLATRLRAIVDPLPDGAAVTLPVEVVRAWLSDVDGEEVVGDYTVEDVGRILDRAPSTVRTWIGSGKLRAYKLGKEWRVTRDAIRELRNGSGEDRPSPGAVADLGSWREVGR